MSTAIEYERLTTGIVNSNLSLADDTTQGNRGDEPRSGFLAELFLGNKTSVPDSSLNSKWHTHYREYR